MASRWTVPNIEDGDGDQLFQGNVVFPRRRLHLEQEIVATTSAEVPLATISSSMVASLGFVGGEDLGQQAPNMGLMESNLLEEAFPSLGRETTISSKYTKLLTIVIRPTYVRCHQQILPVVCRSGEGSNLVKLVLGCWW